MGDATEVLLTTDSSSNQGSASIYNYKAGTCLHNYKSGGIITSNTVAFIKDDYFIGAERQKPLIHVWKTNSQETTKQLKIVTPGPVSSLAVSPDGNYCVAGICEQLYIWNIPSGILLANATKHFQHITKVLFSKDGTYIISSAEDGMVCIWTLNQLIRQLNSMQLEPLYCLTDHTLPIRDMCITTSSKNPYIMTVSSDCTLKINQVDSGELLLSIVFDISLTAVACNILGTQVFIGGTNGDIYEINLINPPRNRTYHDINSDKAKLFSGHTKHVTVLSVSTDGLSLASGAADNQVLIWHVPTRQKLRTINHNGSVINVQFIMSINNMFVEEFKPTVILSVFKRDLTNDINNQRVIEVQHTKDINLPFKDQQNEILPLGYKNVLDNADLYSQINRLKLINSQLYQFSVNCILQEKQSNNSQPQSTDKKRKYLDL